MAMVMGWDFGLSRMKSHARSKAYRGGEGLS